VTVTFVAELPRVAEEAVQVASEGGPVQVKLTLWLNPPRPPTLKVYVADCPGVTVADVEEPDDAARVKSWPVPLSMMICGLPLALSVKFSEALRLPLPVGVSVTPTVQVPLGVTVAPVHVSARLAKSLAFVPPIVTVETVRLARPVLVSIAV